MIEHIASDISVRLNNLSPSSDFDSLVGMEAHMEKMKQMLCLDSADEVRMIGISGPCGIGKTTIAKFLYQQNSHQFQSSTIMANIKGVYASNCRKGRDPHLKLQTRLFSQLRIRKATHLVYGQKFAKMMLKHMKVLVVLDDVDGLEQLDALAENTGCFGPGSRIIIVTQDPRLLRAHGIDHIYKVPIPQPDEARQIFCMYAFGQKSLNNGFEKLAREIATLSGKHPLALRFMGSYLRGLSKKQWENELPRLRTSLDGEIGSIIKFTYDSLCGEDKELSHHHISCLRDGELTKMMENYLGRRFSKVRQELVITNQDLKEDLYTSEGISRGILHAVFIYCEDTLQYSFASHLSKDFRRKGISAFVNYKGTLDVIKGASAAVVVFSKSCFSSTSCLEKLVTVLLSQRKKGQLVVPVCYGVSPSDLVVPEHESADQIREWSSVLQELRELLSHHSREELNECELVGKIVKDVYEKLFPPENIGINLKLLEIQQLLCKEPWGIRRIGIWGMPGIGKTTLAKAVFDQISGGYEVSSFIKHFDKAFHEKGLHRLLEEHFGKILKELPRVCSSITRPSLPGDKLSKKRILVVLDDVQNPLVAESFLRGLHWFGPGSLIIVTSRDKQVFRLAQINHVYQVQSLNEKEALQLFSRCGFGKDMTEQKLLEISMEVIEYASGNPLALSFYGKELKRIRVLKMETTFLKLKLRTSYKIYDLFKNSYETLNDSEKNIFLDIACFFNGENVVYVMPLLVGCGFSPYVGIDVLVEKCLVTISEKRVNMHNLIQDFGREIINGETTDIERRRRLWEPWSIKFLLEDDELRENGDPKSTSKRALGTEDIEGIFLDTSNLLFDVNPSAFKNMLNLRFLKIYCSSYENHCGLRLPKGLQILPYELRLLHWENYPLQSLPQDFDPCHLVELNMSYSQLQKLWGGTKNLDMLKMVRLCHSQQLTEISDISKAQNIELIDLEGCTKLQSFPAIGHLQHLRVVNLSDCREIQSFPEISPNIVELDLQGTGIRELPILIGNATNLKKLYLARCSSLVELPFSIGNTTNLQELNLEYCSSLVELPSSIGNATNLEKLNLGYCSSLVKLPSSIGNATSLKELYLTGCSRLLELPTSIGKVTNLEILDLSNCSSLVELPSSIGNAMNLKKLCLTGCSSLVELPSFIRNVTSLQELSLEYCSSLVELPSSIRNATNLENLYLTGCSSLVELPSSIMNSTSLMSTDLDKDNNLPIVAFSNNPRFRYTKVTCANEGNVFVLEGGEDIEDNVFLTLSIAYKNGSERKIHFPFYQESNTASKVSSEMVEKLDLPDVNVMFMAELIDILLVNLIPTWKTDVRINYLIHSPLNQTEARTQRQEETAFHDAWASFSHSWTSDYPRSDEENKKCVDTFKVEDGCSNQEVEEVSEPVSLEEEERLRQELEEIEVKYQEEMKEIAKKRETAIMDTKKKKSPMKIVEVGAGVGFECRTDL